MRAALCISSVETQYSSTHITQTTWTCIITLWLAHLMKLKGPLANTLICFNRAQKQSKFNFRVAGGLWSAAGRKGRYANMLVFITETMTLNHQFSGFLIWIIWDVTRMVHFETAPFPFQPLWINVIGLEVSYQYFN